MALCVRNLHRMMGKSHEQHVLVRELGIFGAIMMGLGAMLGTGVFVSIAIAIGISGPFTLLAIAIAALVALCNALSSAQLAARHPVSGGTYEYGYRWLSPTLGFSAGWMFVCAKSASAATAALGVSGYLVQSLQLSCSPVWIAAPLTALITWLVFSGMKRSNKFNTLVVSFTLIALILFIGFAFSHTEASAYSLANLIPQDSSTLAPFLQSCALMFVAYTGYGRIATMGEEVDNPTRIIPLAILGALTVSAILYLAIGWVIAGLPNTAILFEDNTRMAAPLEVILRNLNHSNVALWVSIGAITAMIGVLLNLILGVSRVMLAMGRRGDLPPAFSKLNATRTTPPTAVIATGGIIFVLVLIGDVRLTWSFSAFTVLIYYSITNLASLRLPKQETLYPRFVSWAGLISCLFLAFWIDWQVWLSGLVLLSIGVIWHKYRQLHRNHHHQNS